MRFSLRLAVKHLRASSVIAYPTEGVWGLGCDPFSALAVERLLALKSRPVEKGLILLSGQWRWFEPFLDSINQQQRARLTQSWPGAVTWLVPGNNAVPAWIRGSHQAVALRLSAHPLIAELTNAFAGPIVSTSANPAGRSPARSALRVRQYFTQAPHGRDGNDSSFAYLLPGELGDLSAPTPILDLSTGKALR